MSRCSKSGKQSGSRDSPSISLSCSSRSSGNSSFRATWSKSASKTPPTTPKATMKVSHASKEADVAEQRRDGHGAYAQAALEGDLGQGTGCHFENGPDPGERSKPLYGGSGTAWFSIADDAAQGCQDGEIMQLYAGEWCRQEVKEASPWRQEGESEEGSCESIQEDEESRKAWQGCVEEALSDASMEEGPPKALSGLGTVQTPPRAWQDGAQFFGGVKEVPVFPTAEKAVDRKVPDPQFARFLERIADALEEPCKATWDVAAAAHNEIMNPDLRKRACCIFTRQYLELYEFHELEGLSDDTSSVEDDDEGVPFLIGDE